MCVVTVLVLFVCVRVAFGIVYVFGLFVCTSVPAHQKLYYSEDWRTTCYEKDHAYVYMPIGILCGIVYVLGTPTTIFVMLWKNVKHLHDQKSLKHEAITFELGGLFLQYEPSFWYFEIVVIVWKMFMTVRLLNRSCVDLRCVLLHPTVLLCDLLNTHLF